VLSALASKPSINVVYRHWARLVLGWVTARGQVNRLHSADVSSFTHYAWNSHIWGLSQPCNKMHLLPQGKPRDAAVNFGRLKPTYRSLQWHRTFFTAIATHKSRQNNGVKYIYLLPLNSLGLFDSHCLRYKHQRQFKLQNAFTAHNTTPIMFTMMNDRFHCRPNRTVESWAFVSSFGTKIWHTCFVFHSNSRKNVKAWPADTYNCTCYKNVFSRSRKLA